MYTKNGHLQILRMCLATMLPASLALMAVTTIHI
jgi:hypothetical protein